MKRSLPYVPWYHGDFLRSTVSWTFVEQAAYWKLLCAQWEIGPLPDDPNRLATIIGIDAASMANVWPHVSKKFVATAAGLVNERMEAHRQRYLEYRTKQSEGGRKGASSRWQHKNVVPFPKAEGGVRE